MSTSANIVHFPTQEEVETAKQTSRTVSKYADIDRVQMTIRSNGNPSEDLVMPGPVMQILLDVLSEMSKGNAISLIPIHHELSTQQAANILNVSRPHLIKLLEERKIPFHKVGAHRRVLAKDVMSYKDEIDKQRQKTLEELTAVSQELDMEY